MKQQIKNIFKKILNKKDRCTFCDCSSFNVFFLEDDINGSSLLVKCKRCDSKIVFPIDESYKLKPYHSKENGGRNESIRGEAEYN